MENHNVAYTQSDSTMEIIQITNHKKQYLELLLLADEQESMIDRYLGRGEIIVLENDLR
jgi:hypothetical protein